MRTIQTNVYQFDELPEDVQDKILENWGLPNYDWWNYIYEDAENIGCKITGFDISGPSYIDMEVDDERTAELILEQHGEGCDTYRLAEIYLEDLYVLEKRYGRAEHALNAIEDKFGDLYPYQYPAKYYKAYRRIDELCDELLEDIPELHEQFRGDISREYIYMLRKEWEYMNSREYITEHIRANGYEFTADGELYQ